MRQMMITLSVLCLVMPLAPCPRLYSVQHAQQSDKSGGIAEKRVCAFDAEGLSLLDALLQLGRQEHVPIGMEYLDPNDLSEPISVHLRGTAVGGVVKAILNQRRGYTWRAKNGVIHIDHLGVPPSNRNLLDVVLREFSIPERTVLFTAAAVGLRAQLERQIHPPKPTTGVTGVVGSILGGRIENQVGPLTLRNVTVREVLDRLVCAQNNAAWVILVPPTRMDQIPARGLWYLIEYNAPPDHWSEFIGTLLREHWPPRSEGEQKQ